jgi:hypothetical protein
MGAVVASGGCIGVPHPEVVVSGGFTERQGGMAGFSSVM